MGDMKSREIRVTDLLTTNETIEWIFTDMDIRTSATSTVFVFPCIYIDL